MIHPVVHRGVTAAENAFESLCALATEERWCWKMSCTTCGHGNFRWAFQAIARGMHPSAPEWPVHWGADWSVSRLKSLNGPLPRIGGLSLPDQRRLQEIVASSQLRSIQMSSPFPDWLGYLGLALRYTQRAEGAAALITTAMIPQLRPSINGQSSAAALLDGLEGSGSDPLRWQDLERIEEAWLFA